MKEIKINHHKYVRMDPKHAEFILLNKLRDEGIDLDKPFETEMDYETGVQIFRQYV